jgi:tetratricopeptide (TPR) repeat protein
VKEDIKEAEGFDDTLLLDGIELIEGNKLEAALECFETFSDKYPKIHFGPYYVAYTKLIQDKKKQAMKFFKKATKLKEDFLPSLYYQGLIEFENNEFAKALQFFDQIMENFPSEDIKESGFNIPYFIAICYHYLGNLERAEEYFMFAFNISPFDPTVLYYKGFNELALKKYDYAVETFKNLLAVDLNYSEFWDLFKGYSFFFMENKEKIEEEK